jgi:hypothetical protein
VGEREFVLENLVMQRIAILQFVTLQFVILSDSEGSFSINDEDSSLDSIRLVLGTLLGNQRW